MAQAGIHAWVSTTVRKVSPKREWLMPGIILGNIFPDLDNYAVAVATVARLNTHGLHRTFTHSFFTIEFLFFALYFAWLAKTAQAHKTNADFLGKLRLWMIAMVVLLVVFTPLAYLMSKGFLTIFGLFYLISITAAFVITIRMRETIADVQMFER